MIEFVFLVVKAVLFLAVGVGMVPFLIYFERKFAGFFQTRVGPTYASLESSRKLALKVDEEWDHAHTNGEEQHGFDHQEDKFNHRSLSPSTTSTLPKMPTESASVSPSNSGGTAWQ